MKEGDLIICFSSRTCLEQRKS